MQYMSQWREDLKSTLWKHKQHNSTKKKKKLDLMMKLRNSFYHYHIYYVYLYVDINVYKKKPMLNSTLLTRYISIIHLVACVVDFIWLFLFLLSFVLKICSIDIFALISRWLNCRKKQLFVHWIGCVCENTVRSWL